MNNETKKVLALVALIVTTGVGTIEMTRSTAQANTAVAGGPGYAGERVEQAFTAAAEIPPIALVGIPGAGKGDLTPAVAYNVKSGPYVVVETRGESTSILTRMMGYTVADLKTTLTE